MWAICSFVGYIYDLDIYTCKCGTDACNPLSSVGLGSRVVVKILQNLLEKTEREKLKKYHLFFDNFFTSSDLMIHLQKIGQLEEQVSKIELHNCNGLKTSTSTFH